MGAKVQTTLSIPSSHFPPQKVGKTYSEEELQALFAEVDLNGNGTSAVFLSLHIWILPPSHHSRCDRYGWATSGTQPLWPSFKRGAHLPNSVLDKYPMPTHYHTLPRLTYGSWWKWWIQMVVMTSTSMYCSLFDGTGITNSLLSYRNL